MGKELYVFGGVQTKEHENPDQRHMTTCKSEFYHDDMRRSVDRRTAGDSSCGNREGTRGGRHVRLLLLWLGTHYHFIWCVSCSI